jgi:16S rRNA processing protein RimM
MAPQMDKKGFLEAGKIVNTHGIHGEVRIEPWVDSPAFLASIKTLYIDGKPISVVSARTHKSFLLTALEGVIDVGSAIKLKNKIVCINREDVRLEDGQFFIADLIGLRAIDSKTDEVIGIVSDVMSLPSQNVYVITGTQDNSAKERLIPAVKEFVDEINTDAGYIKFSLIEGM